MQTSVFFMEAQPRWLRRFGQGTWIFPRWKR